MTTKPIRTITIPNPGTVGFQESDSSCVARDRNNETQKTPSIVKESESRRLLVTEKTVRGEPVAHRGIFGRRGHTSFGEFLALFRQQVH